MLQSTRSDKMTAVGIETHLCPGISGHQVVSCLKDLAIQMSNPVILNHLSSFLSS